MAQASLWDSNDDDDDDDEFKVPWSDILDVSCEMELSLNGQPSQLLAEKVKVQWNKSGAWDILDSKAWEWLTEQGIPENDAWHTTVLRYGYFKIIGRKHESLPRKLSLREHLPEVFVVEVCRFISEHLRETFKLRVRWDYESVAIAQVKEEEYQSTIRNELSEKYKVNFRGQKFFPRHALGHILPEYAALIILEQDRSLNLNNEEMERFRMRLRECNRLLVLCIWKRLSMKMLKSVLDANPELNDVHLLTQGMHGISHGALNPRSSDWKDFIEALAAFRPYRFPSSNGTVNSLFDEGECVIPKDVVVPICHEKEEETIVGEGSFSRVLAVKLDPSYHVYTQDRGQLFALKRFTSQPSKRAEHFARERKVLAKLDLAPRHRNLVAPYAAWSQGSEFYILFPLATGNLETFMNYLPCLRTAQEPRYRLRFDPNCMPYDENTKLPILDYKFVKWLFTELQGLAEALDHIHHLASYHHDIKPDNILMFVDDKSSYGTMKFGDFGAGKVMETYPDLYTKSPVFTEKQRGAIAFASPDLYCDGKVAAEADIWSLGCVFLEILLWCLEPRSVAIKGFATERAEEQSGLNYNPNMQVDQYWKVDKTARAVLKESVKKKFKGLEKLCKPWNMDAFRYILRSTEQMMSTDSSKRVASSKLLIEMRFQRNIAMANLWKSPNFYCGQVNESKVRNNISVRFRSPSPQPLDSPQQRLTTVEKRVYEDLINTDGMWQRLVTTTGASDDILAEIKPPDVSTRHEVDHGAAAFPAIRGRSISSQRAAAILRRNLSEPRSNGLSLRSMVRKGGYL
ncbi:hypothetical protein LTR10_018829 [Elasticomyces elasticus]|uniref:Protein kinase domain-containing protein n=1 Tax=Exophiala sideris TaxID=1016849 RepID=A0ABR0IW15_9EURO|nr:hypothetical protein LTR10_018829 [Elasticomyces elasticus]KAK5021628.1 hypothetical protein LTS07_010799 [Exophiala sideris]KAK5049766.1 hypothetical protein LTR69_010823 [Exophiala sideris]KAK5176746.1 hypothetical protein LTR44_010689 [Eurotiomycetes sp. CCFEE 6388]